MIEIVKYDNALDAKIGDMVDISAKVVHITASNNLIVQLTNGVRVLVGRSDVKEIYRKDNHEEKTSSN